MDAMYGHGHHDELLNCVIVCRRSGGLLVLSRVLLLLLKLELGVGVLVAEVGRSGEVERGSRGMREA